VTARSTIPDLTAAAHDPGLDLWRVHQRKICRSFIVGIFLEERGVKLDVYELLLRINAGFDQAIRGLAALQRHAAFHRSTLERFAALSKETRAATNSYVTSVIETAETNEAGRRFRERRAQERADEQGN
jgi:hypothetical protein